MGKVSAAAPEMAIDTELLLRIFGDYIAAVASRMGAIRRAHLLVGILQTGLKEPALFQSLAKCKNFLIHLAKEILSLFMRSKGPSIWITAKEELRMATMRNYQKQAEPGE